VNEPTLSSAQRKRRILLRDIFSQLDNDHDGNVHITDLGALGKDGQLGTRVIVVGEEQTCTEVRFVETYEKVLPSDEDGFNAAVARMLHLAKLIRAERDTYRSGERSRQLRAIFEAFDVDSSKMLDDSEVLLLTKAESHSTGADWSTDRSKRIIKEMDRDANGKISCQEFLQHFEPALSYKSELYASSIDQFIRSAEMILDEKEGRRVSKYDRYDSYERAVKEAEDATRRARLQRAKAALIESKAESTNKVCTKDHAVASTSVVLSEHEVQKAQAETVTAKSEAQEKKQAKEEAEARHHAAIEEYNRTHKIETACDEEVIAAERKCSAAKSTEIKASRAVKTAEETATAKENLRSSRARIVRDLEEQLRLAKIALAEADEMVTEAQQGVKVKHSEHSVTVGEVTAADENLAQKRAALGAAKKVANEKEREEQDKGREFAQKRIPWENSHKIILKKEQTQEQKEADSVRMKKLREKKAEQESVSELAVEDAKLRLWRAQCWVIVREAEEAAARAWQRAAIARKACSNEHTAAAGYEEKAERQKLLAEFESTKANNETVSNAAKASFDKVFALATDARKKERDLDKEAEHYAEIARGFQRTAQIEREKVEASERDEAGRAAAARESKKAALERANAESAHRAEAARYARLKEEEKMRKEQEALREKARLLKAQEIKDWRAKIARDGKKAAQEAAKSRSKRAQRVHHLQHVFKKWDADRNRKIDYKEFYALGQAVYPEDWSLEAAKKIFDGMDRDKSGDVDETEFILFMLEHAKGFSDRQYEQFIGKLMNQCKKKAEAAKGMSPEEAARRKAAIDGLYKMFDTNGDGVVGFDEFLSLAKLFEGKNFTLDIAKRVYDKMDKDKDGGIDGNEFESFVFKKTTKLNPEQFDKLMKQMNTVATAQPRVKPTTTVAAVTSVTKPKAQVPKAAGAKETAVKVKVGTPQTDDSITLADVTEFIVEDIKSSNPTMTNKGLQDALKGGKFDDYINWYGTKASKMPDYKPGNTVTEADVKISVAKYLVLGRGAEIKEATEATLQKKRGISKSQSTVSSKESESTTANAEEKKKPDTAMANDKVRAEEQKRLQKTKQEEEKKKEEEKTKEEEKKTEEEKEQKRSVALEKKKTDRTKKIKEVLEVFGPDWTGTVSKAEFQQLGKALEGPMWSESRGKEMFAKVDKDKLGFITNSDFMAFIIDGKQFLSLGPSEFDELATRLKKAILRVVDEAKKKKGEADKLAKEKQKKAEQDAMIAAEKDGQGKKSETQKSSSSVEPKDRANSKTALAGVPGGTKFEGSGDQKMDSADLEKKLADDMAATDAKLKEKSAAKAKLAVMSDEEIAAESMGMSLKEYRQMMGL